MQVIEAVVVDSEAEADPMADSSVAMVVIEEGEAEEEVEVEQSKLHRQRSLMDGDTSDVKQVEGQNFSGQA